MSEGKGPSKTEGPLRLIKKDEPAPEPPTRDPNALPESWQRYNKLSAVKKERIFEGEKLDKFEKLLGHPALWIDYRILPSAIKQGEKYALVLLEANLDLDPYAAPKRYVGNCASKSFMDDLERTAHLKPFVATLTQKGEGARKYYRLE